MTRYEDLKALVQKWREPCPPESMDHGAAIYFQALGKCADELEAALALPEDSKVVNAELDLPNAELYSPTVAIEWISEVFPEWTTLQIMANGTAFAFNRVNGKVYKIPDPNVPFIQMTEQYKVIRDGDKVRFE